MPPPAAGRFLALILALALPALAHAGMVDTLALGSPTSEQAHALEPEQSDVVAGTLGESARRLLPLPKPDWQGGRLRFVMKVDPALPNYFTARFSGDETTGNRLILFVEGKQIGWRHLGEVEQLDFGSEEPAYPGRFYYHTSPLPLPLTKGKSEVACEIRSSGPIWTYGTNWDQYQKPMTQPSRGIYRVYTHTDGFFVPPSEEKQGTAPARQSPPPPAPGPEVLDQIRAQVNHQLDEYLASGPPLNQVQMSFVALACDIQWTHAWQKPSALAQIVRTLDALFAGYCKNPTLAQAEPSTWNPEWFGLGVAGQVISLRARDLQPELSKQIDDGRGGHVTRRDAYTKMLIACRDWHRLNRRLYTNQTMINDLYGIYLANRGVAVLKPGAALPEPVVRRYLYESVGLEPWRNSDPGGRQWEVGKDYFQLTDKGLTRELGYVGTYGDVLDWVNAIYDGTRPTPTEPGDQKIREQLIKIALARAQFRHPAVDAHGQPLMRLEQVVGWRDSHYPGFITYGQRPTWDASALETAANTLDPRMVGYAQQMLADRQFFSSELEVNNQGLRSLIGRLRTPDEYALIMKQPRSPVHLPMTADQPDFVFSDEEDGVLAVKNGPEILYVSLYWRARYGINNLARVHDLTPQFDRLAEVAETTAFTPSGLDSTRPNWVNMAFGGGGVSYPGDLQSAYTGEKLPIAKIPEGVNFKPGDESIYAGKGDFYTLRYGPYLIGMNMTKDRTFDLKAPLEAGRARKLGTASANLPAGAVIKVSPRSTVVLYFGPTPAH